MNAGTAQQAIASARRRNASRQKDADRRDAVRRKRVDARRRKDSEIRSAWRRAGPSGQK